MAKTFVAPMQDVPTTTSREVIAVVWAENDKQAVIAEDFLSHALWPYWYQFRITKVRRVLRDGPCPLRQAAPEVLACTCRDRWAWVLVAPNIDLEAVTACT